MPQMSVIRSICINSHNLHYVGEAISERTKKLNDLLRDEVGKILKGELDLDNETLITVVRADVSPTLEHATIWVSVFPESEREAVLQKINRQIYPLQQILNKRLSMRPVPKVRFEIDKTEEGVARIERLIDNSAKS
jgi:ribosome-binding factor A